MNVMVMRTALVVGQVIGPLLGLGAGAASLGGCGGAAATAAPRATASRPRPRADEGVPMMAPAPVGPIQVRVLPRRTGGALELAIQVEARGHAENEPFEDASAWTVEVLDERGGRLRRLMNGPRRIDREPVGREDGSQWDVTVRHSIFFELPKVVPKVKVRLVVPGASAYEAMAEVPVDDGA